MYSLDDLRLHDHIRVFGATPAARAALAMARVHVHPGNAPLAREFIKVGLQKVGSATALRRSLHELAASLR